jgi:hypothetical protein
MINAPFEAKKTLRIGFLGVGGRGGGLLGETLAAGRLLAKSDVNVQIAAIFDTSVERARAAAARAEKETQIAPRVETADFGSILSRGELDMVVIATPWDWHVPMAIAAMEHGIHAAVEVPAAVTLEDCWALVDASERTRRHCVILENCIYGYEELLMFNLSRMGYFGTITHGEAAYIHDLRDLLLAEHSEGLWRRFPHVERKGNLYPTHGLGPIARCMDIHRGDRFTRLVSMSSREASLTEYRDAHLSPDDHRRAEKYQNGDMNTSLIQTALGRTIQLQHDVTTPRPYSRGTLLQGTQGAFRDFPAGVYKNGEGDHVNWMPLEKVKEHEHPLWRDMGQLAKDSGGHGGMDFLMMYRLLYCLAEGLPPDMDVYDAAVWSAPGPLSDQSLAEESHPINFPDFTRGRWKDAAP